jgi:hypothetical protein
MDFKVARLAFCPRKRKGETWLQHGAHLGQAVGLMDPREFQPRPGDLGVPLITVMSVQGCHMSYIKARTFLHIHFLLPNRRNGWQGRPRMGWDWEAVQCPNPLSSHV